MDAFLKKHNTVMGALLTLLGGIGWGISGTCGQYLFTEKGVTSFWLVPVRLVIAGFVLLVPLFAKNAGDAIAPWKDKRDRRELLIYGLAGITLCQLTYFGTIQLSSAGVATILQDLSPILILLYVCFSAKRAPGSAEVGSILLALAGVVLIVTHGELSAFAVSPAALATGIISAVAVAIYNIVPKRLMQRHSTVLLQGWSFLLGGILLSVLFRPWQYTVAVDAGLIAGFCAVVLLGNVLAFNAYVAGVRLIGPEKGILYGFSEPVTAAMLSFVWLGAPFTAWDAAGFAAIFLMLVLLSLPKRKNDAIS